METLNNQGWLNKNLKAICIIFFLVIFGYLFFYPDKIKEIKNIFTESKSSNSDFSDKKLEPDTSLGSKALNWIKNNQEDEFKSNMFNQNIEKDKTTQKLNKKDQDSSIRLKSNNSEKENQVSKELQLEELRKRLTKPKPFEDFSTQKDNVNKNFNAPDPIKREAYKPSPVIESNVVLEDERQSLTKEEFEKYKKDLEKEKAEKHETISQEKITDQKKIDALNKASATLKEAGFSEKEIVENLEKGGGMSLSDLGPAEKKLVLKKTGLAKVILNINGIKLEKTEIPVTSPKPKGPVTGVGSYYKHAGYWYMEIN